MKSILLLIAFLIPVTLFSQNNQDRSLKIPDEINNSTREFFENIINDQVEAAYLKLLSGSLIMADQDNVDHLIEQTEKSVDLYGAVNGFELAKAEFASPSYVKLSYITLNELLPMRWIFIYYKSPQSGWVITNIEFDDLTENLFTDE